MKIRLKKGLRLNIAGSIPANASVEPVHSKAFAVYPDDFPGFVPKVDVKEGDAVMCGSSLMHDKNHPDVNLVSPVSGSVKAVVRGERRKVIRIELEANGDGQSVNVPVAVSDSKSAKQLLASTGMLAMMRRRPYDIIPSPDDEVRDIFVTAFDEAPLAPEYSVYTSLFSAEDYQAGIDLLSKTTSGSVYVSHKSGFAFTGLKNAVMVEFDGPFPASNVGVQIANIKPVNKGEVVWTLDFVTVGRIGHMVKTGTCDFSTVVAVTGPELDKPGLVRTTCGAAIAPIVEPRLKATSRRLRIISGNVLTGVAEDADGYLRFPYRQITVIDEGDDVEEFMGWASFSPSKMSENSSFPGHFLSKSFRPDARINGGRRAMIVSGQYDRYMPMDILPEYLLKAIISNNIDDMEKLGIYEVAPEDFAAAEYADTSKLPLQQIVREGLESLRKELE